jgi:hypothetical protein
MTFNTSKRGFILVLIALCLIIVGAPVLADESAGPKEDPDTGLFAINPMFSSGSPVLMTLFPVKPDEGTDLFTSMTQLKTSGYAGTSTAFRPSLGSANKTVSPLFNVLLGNFRANPRPLLSPPGGNAPLYCSGGY